MLYSVYNFGSSQYDYYETAEPQASLNTEKPSHLRNRTLGATVDQAAWPLPPTAKRIGSGPDAVGRVAVKKTGAALGDISTDNPLVKGGLLAVAAVLAYKYVVKPGRRKARR